MEFATLNEHSFFYNKHLDNYTFPLSDIQNKTSIAISKDYIPKRINSKLELNCGSLESMPANKLLKVMMTRLQQAEN